MRRPSPNSSRWRTNSIPGEVQRPVSFELHALAVVRRTTALIPPEGRWAYRNTCTPLPPICLLHEKLRGIGCLLQMNVRLCTRDGYPDKCLLCSKTLHSKSEHYCSNKCADNYRENHGGQSPPFLSKWKIRKKIATNDPLVAIRKKARSKTHHLVNKGIVVKKTCVVCGEKEVIAHHEDYSKPYDIIWLCDNHHIAYHEGKMGLHNNKLWWNPIRLLPKEIRKSGIPKKYQVQIQQFNLRNQQLAEQVHEPDGPTCHGPCVRTDRAKSPRRLC